MACVPSQPFVRLARRYELVLVKPSADVIPFDRAFEANVALMARCVDAGAHDVEAQRPVFIAEVKDFAADHGLVCLGGEPIGFGEIGNMNPGPAAFAIAAKHRAALFRHSEPIGADAVIAVVAEHEAGPQDSHADILERQRLAFELAAKGERMVRIGLRGLVHDSDGYLTENRASGRVNQTPPW